MLKIEIAEQYETRIATDNYYGYSQARRGDRDKDCSKLQIDALKFAGYDTGLASFTGDMLTPLLAAGFADVTKSVNLRTGDGLHHGYILLRPKTKLMDGHAAMMINDKELVQASGDYDGVPGDSSGNEIKIKPYYDSPFTYVLAPPPEFATLPVNPHQRPTKLYASGKMIYGNDASWIIWQLNRLGYPGLLKGVPIVGPNCWKAIKDVQIRKLGTSGDMGLKTYYALEQ